MGRSRNPPAGPSETARASPRTGAGRFRAFVRRIIAPRAFVGLIWRYCSASISSTDAARKLALNIAAVVGLGFGLAFIFKGAFFKDSVVIDPISNLISIGSDTEVNSMLLRLVDFLKIEQITGFFTSLTSGGAVLEGTELGISSLMDTWLLLRDIELNGRIALRIAIGHLHTTEHHVRRAWDLLVRAKTDYDAFTTIQLACTVTVDKLAARYWRKH